MCGVTRTYKLKKIITHKKELGNGINRDVKTRDESEEDQRNCCTKFKII